MRKLDKKIDKTQKKIGTDQRPDKITSLQP
jgi:hypothetical protein